jgi:NAD(P)H-hydrate repair Nnr-like enzyme with NAD(P)H-hydrate epimerase domain
LPADDPELFELDLRGLRGRWASTAARPPIGAEAMTGADRRAQALGVPGERLMEQAGTAVAAAALALAGDTDRRITARSSSSAARQQRWRRLVAARRLAAHGVRVIVGLIASTARPSRPTREELGRIVRDERITIVHAPVARDVMVGPRDREGRDRRRRPARHRRPRSAARADPIGRRADQPRREAMVPVLAVDTPTAIDLTSVTRPIRPSGRT